MRARPGIHAAPEEMVVIDTWIAGQARNDSLFRLSCRAGGDGGDRCMDCESGPH